MPQGAVLSTTSFALYISDMPHPPHTLLALYADDTAIIAQSWRTDTIAHRLSHAMSMLLRSFSKWKLQVNIHKTEAILFTRRRLIAPAPLRSHRSIAPWMSQVRYLVLTLDSKLLFTEHITSVTHKATDTLLQLFPLLAPDSTLNTHNKITLYKLFIRSALTYAATVWSYISPSTYHRLQVLQSK